MRGLPAISGSSPEQWWSRYGKETGEIEVLLKVVGERIEGGVDELLVGDGTDTSAQPREKGTAKTVPREKAVQIAPGDAAIRADRSVLPAREAQHWPHHAGPARVAEMDLIPSNRQSARDIDPCGVPKLLFAAEHRVDLEQPEPGNLLCPAFDPEWIGNCSPEHLVATAQAEDVPAVTAMRQDVDVPAFAAQKHEIGDRCLRAWYDHQRRVARYGATRPDDVDLDTRLGPQWVEIVEIGDPRQQRHRYADRRLPLSPSLSPLARRKRDLRSGRLSGQRQRIFGGERPRGSEVGHDTE